MQEHKRYSVVVHFYTGSERSVLCTDSLPSALAEYRAYLGGDAIRVYVSDGKTGQILADSRQRN